MILKVVAEQGANEIIKNITNQTLLLNLISQNNSIVQYNVVSNDSFRNLVTLKLNFSEPDKISSSTDPDVI